jgi:putative transposase
MIEQARPTLGVQASCVALGFPRASFYRQRQEAPPPGPRPTPARALSGPESDAVRAVLREERFVDSAPAQVYAQLLDENRYLCSIRTMYRVLEESQEVRERRDQLRHPSYAAPELLATGPNQLWSWDITKLRGPVKWSMFYLYVILDVFSRYAVGWMVAHRESASLAQRLIAETVKRQAEPVKPGETVDGRN